MLGQQQLEVAKRMLRGCSTVVNIIDNKKLLWSRYIKHKIDNDDENYYTAQPKNSRYSIRNKTYIKILTATGVDDSVPPQRTMYLKRPKR